MFRDRSRADLPPCNAMNPYEVLGIASDATPHQIKVAYRRRAMETHPDRKDGNADEFAQVSKAYGLLIDTETRRRYDETGEVDGGVTPMSVHARMVVIIAGMFNEALNIEGQRGTSFDHFDLMKAMRDQMGKNLTAVEQNRAAFRKRIADRKILLRRITRKDDGENLFAQMVRDQLAQLEPLLRQAEIDVLAMQMAVDELSHYKSEVELVQAVQYMQFGGQAFASSSSTTGSVFFGGR